MKQFHRYSQNFLRDKGILKKIAHSLDSNNAIIVEVGSGDGRLSDYLRRICRKLYCIEIDKRFCLYLQKRFANDKRVTIINGDILRWPLAMLGERIVLVGNIPYHISKQFIRYCVANGTFIQNAYCMFQREFADKLLAKVSTAGYCALTCFFQYYATAKRLFDVPARAFSPAPSVRSSFVKIDFRNADTHKAANDDFLLGLIETAFSQRRKKIINSLVSYPDSAMVLAKLGINSNARPDNISLSEYVRLANALYLLHKQDKFSRI